MRYEAVGVTDERDTCDICGKTGLKRVVVLRDDEGEYIYAGTTCAAKPLGRSSREVKAIVENLERAQAAQERADQLRTSYLARHVQRARKAGLHPLSKMAWMLGFGPHGQLGTEEENEESFRRWLLANRWSVMKIERALL